MLAIARTLSVLSAVLTVTFAVVIIGSGRWQLFRLGFEGYGVAGGYSFSLAAFAALLALVIAIVRARLGKRAGFAQVALTSVISLLVLVVVAMTG
jgi:hypothetical protein